MESTEKQLEMANMEKDNLFTNNKRGEKYFKLKFLYLAITVFSNLYIVGCSSDQGEGNTSDTDSYENVREIAWEFIEEEGWNDSAKDDWKSAEVKKMIADESYELLDETYEGKEVLSVSFEDKKNVVVGTPLILVALDTNEVIGYMLGE
jgi:hypothetical protein